MGHAAEHFRGHRTRSPQKEQLPPIKPGAPQPRPEPCRLRVPEPKLRRNNIYFETRTQLSRRNTLSCVQRWTPRSKSPGYSDSHPMGPASPSYSDNHPMNPAEAGIFAPKRTSPLTGRKNNCYGPILLKLHQSTDLVELSRFPAFQISTTQIKKSRDRFCPPARQLL